MPSLPADNQDVIQLQSAREEAESEATRLRLVDALTEVILRHPRVDTLLRELVERIQTIMRVDNVAILRVNAAGSELTMDTVRGPEELAENQVHIPVGQGVAGRIFASRQPLIVEDLSRVDIVNSFLSQHLHSLLGVPLLVDEQAIGVLHISTIHPRTFTSKDVQILQLVADRIALALDRARMLREAQQAQSVAEQTTNKLHAFQAINDVVLRHYQLDDLVRSLLPEVSYVMQVDNVAILLPATELELTLYSAFGPEHVVVGSVHVPIGAGVAGRIMATGQPLVIDDLAKSDAVNPFLREHLHSLLGVPLRVEDRVLGVLHVSTVLPHSFSPDDLELLQLVASRIALAIDRAQAFAATKAAQAEAEERALQLAELNERMDNFLSIASHELRTPLTSTLANVDLLPRRLQRMIKDGASPEQISDFVLVIASSIRRQARRLNGLVNDLLDVSRIKADKLEIRLSAQDVRPTVRETVEELRVQFPERMIDLTLPDVPSIAMIDEDRISQVVTNFLTNALKFAPPDQPITVTASIANQAVTVAVCDRGQGIPLAEQARVWERFQRVDTVGHLSGSSVGLGLGLFICRTIIERHQGEIGLTSQVGEGSTFWFRLALASPTESGTAPDQAVPLN